MTDIFQELAEYRQQLDLPPAGSDGDRATIAKLEIDGNSFFGINSGSNPHSRKITMTVNPISRTHAEADAFQQMFDAGIKGGKEQKINNLCVLVVLRNSLVIPFRKIFIKNDG